MSESVSEGQVGVWVSGLDIWECALAFIRVRDRVGGQVLVAVSGRTFASVCLSV